MYDAKRDQIEQLRVAFEAESTRTSPEARHAAGEYLRALADFVRVTDKGSLGDPGMVRLDSTGTLDRMNDHAIWARQEMDRVAQSVGRLA